jgi:hypothetical protein
MNPQTGEIRQMTAEDLKKADGEWLQIDPNRMTRKQRRAMRVSLSDHTSDLGKLATATRQQRRHAQQAAEYQAGVAKQGKRYIKGFHNNPLGLPHVGAKQMAKMARQNADV